MASSPNGYQEFRTSRTFISHTHGRLTIYANPPEQRNEFEPRLPGFSTVGEHYNQISVPNPAINRHADVGFKVAVMWEPPQDEGLNHNCEVWENGLFKDRELERLARLCSTETADMIHWLEEEVLKFVNQIVPVEV